VISLKKSPPSDIDTDPKAVAKAPTDDEAATRKQAMRDEARAEAAAANKAPDTKWSEIRRNLLNWSGAMASMRRVALSLQQSFPNPLGSINHPS